MPQNLPPGQEPETPYLDLEPKNLPQAEQAMSDANAGG